MLPHMPLPLAAIRYTMPILMRVMITPQRRQMTAMPLRAAALPPRYLRRADMMRASPARRPYAFADCAADAAAAATPLTPPLMMSFRRCCRR